MKNLSTLILVLFTTYGISQKSIYLDCKLEKTKKKDAVFVKHELSNDFITTEIFFHINTSDTFKVKVTDYSTKTSEETTFWLKGTKRIISEYKNNVLHGTRTTYYWNGGIKYEDEFLQGFKEGISKSYSVEGILDTETTYFNNKRNGLSKSFNYSDSVITTFNYVNNNKEGVSFKKLFTGAIIDSCFYENDKIIGIRKQFYETGELKSQLNYENGKKVGEQIYFNKNGVKEKIEIFENGKLSSTQNLVTGELESSKFDIIYSIVEKQPEYPGGYEKLFMYLGKTIKYPIQAKECGIKGKVYVQFVVEKDGSLSDIKLLRGIGGGCDEEALEAIENMPKWIPGEQREKPVRVRFTLPVNFTLR